MPAYPPRAECGPVSSRWYLMRTLCGWMPQPRKGLADQATFGAFLHARRASRHVWAQRGASAPEVHFRASRVATLGPGGPIETSRGPVAPGSASPLANASRQGRMKAVLHGPDAPRPTRIAPHQLRAALQNAAGVGRHSRGSRLIPGIPPGCVGTHQTPSSTTMGDALPGGTPAHPGLTVRGSTAPRGTPDSGDSAPSELRR